MFRRTWLTVDLDRMRKNYETVCARVPAGCEVFAVVKANACGHGDVPCAKALEKSGARTFCVATGTEAVALREGGIRGDILVLSYVAPQDIPALLEYRIFPTIVGPEHAREMEEAAAALGAVLPVHLKINTGMNRVGFDCDTPEELEALAAAYALPHLKIVGTFSHFSSADDASEGADEYTLMQMEKFERALAFLKERGVDPGVRHLANSPGITKFARSAYDAVRVAILMQGYNTASNCELMDVVPCATWQALIVCIRTVKPGGCVGYSRKFRAEKPTRVAVVAVGYADGWPRALSNRGTVLLHGRRARILGNICMDQTMIDVTDIPEAKVGDAVTLVGTSGALTQTADDVVAPLGTCVQDLYSRLGTRVERVYVNE